MSLNTGAKKLLFAHTRSGTYLLSVTSLERRTLVSRQRCEEEDELGLREVTDSE